LRFGCRFFARVCVRFAGAPHDEAVVRQQAHPMCADCHRARARPTGVPAVPASGQRSGLPFGSWRLAVALPCPALPCLPSRILSTSLRILSLRRPWTRRQTLPTLPPRRCMPSPC
jgi:hypothetical protein